MTVCIAAIAARSKALVLVADKSASYLIGGETQFKADVAFKKIFTMHSGWVALIAGPMDFGERVIRLADETFYIQVAEATASDDKFVAITPMPECLKTAYQICRKIEVVDHILKPRLLTEEWYETKVKGVVSANDDFFITISKEIDSFNNESVIALCGFEQGQPQVYLISNPGVLNCNTPEGFAAIGVGQETALNRLYTLETDPDDSIEKVLYDLFDAKEACTNSLPEVGREWDAMVLYEGAVSAQIEATPEIIDAVEAIFDAHPKSPFLKPEKKDSKGARGKLKKWIDSIVSPDQAASAS